MQETASHRSKAVQYKWHHGKRRIIIDGFGLVSSFLFMETTTKNMHIIYYPRFCCTMPMNWCGEHIFFLFLVLLKYLSRKQVIFIWILSDIARGFKFTRFSTNRRIKHDFTRNEGLIVSRKMHWNCQAPKYLIIMNISNGNDNVTGFKPDVTMDIYVVRFAQMISIIIAIKALTLQFHSILRWFV